jgi:hypothetical protein
MLAIFDYFVLYKNVLTIATISSIYSLYRNIALSNENDNERKNNMRRELTVRSTVIHWPENEMDIKDTEGNKYTIPLDQAIDVTMKGYPDRTQKTMLARELGPYMERGWIIEHIAFEEEAQP